MSSAAGDRPDTQDELDLVTVIDTIVSNRWSILLITAVFALLGVTWAFLSHPQYQADILVQVEDSPDAAASSLLGTVSSLFDVKSSAAAEAQIITSRLVVARSVDALRLYIDASPKRFPLVGEFVSRFNTGITRPGVVGIGGYAWGQESVDVARFDVPKEIEGDKFSLTMEADGRYRLSGSDLDQPVHGQVGVASTFSTGYGPIALQVTSFNAQPGTRFTLIRNSRVDTIADLQSNLDVQEKVKQSGVIVATLTDGDSEKVSRTLQEVGNQYVRQNIERKSADAAQSLSFLNTQLPVLLKQLRDAEQRYTTMRNQRGTVDLSEEAKLALQQGADAKTQLLMLQQKRAELATRFNDEHPDIVALDRQIGILRQQQDVMEGSLRRLPDIERDAAELTLDVKVDTDLYTALLNNSQQLQLVKAGKVGSVRLIDSPIVADLPVKPNRPVVIAGATLVGLVLGLVFAFVRELLFAGVTTADEIERGTELGVFASIPTSAAQKELHKRLADRPGHVQLLATEAPQDQAVESLRSLRTALQFSMLSDLSKVVLVTGAAPGVGKSFVTANLGGVLASTGKRVVIIDADLRRGYLNQYFGVGRMPGLSDLIAGKEADHQTVQRIAQPRLDFIAAGTTAPNPAELLLSERTGRLIEMLRDNYDYVLIDAPPMLAVDDAAVLGKHAGTVLLVARAGETRIGDLNESIKRLRAGGAKPTGVVLNGLPVRSARYAYGSKHGDYRYTSYDYGVTPQKRGLFRRIGDALRVKRGN
jgi:tyrosine-protein kinase Etk/Wzc